VPAAPGPERDRLEVIAAQADAVIESAPIGIGLFDLQLRHVRVNPVLEEMNGLPAEELLGRTPADLHPEVGREAEALDRDVLRSGRPRRDVPLTAQWAAGPAKCATGTPASSPIGMPVRSSGCACWSPT
jgi:PAS domain-containing protein